MNLWVYSVWLPPYELYNPFDGHQEAISVLLKPQEVLHMVCRWDSLRPSITHIVYSRNCIWLRWPTLLMMAWGITIHKSQGLTLEKVVVELGGKDFSTGLSFVAISQVKILQCLAFCTRIAHACLKKPKETDSMLMLKGDNEHYN